jgi:hypothetical protein
MILLLACRPAAIPSDSAPLVPSEPDPTEAIGDAPDTDTRPDTDTDGCAAIYDPDVLQAFSIEISDAELLELEEDYARGEKDYHPIVFTWGDESVDAHIRLKGNPYFSWYVEKKQFVVAFNVDDSAGRFHGLRKLSLDGGWYEPTLLRDRIAWDIIRRQGELPYACANSATLTINGDYYGLYTNIEFFDHEWLERSFGREGAVGTLWKYGTEAEANAEASTGAAIARMNDTLDPDALAELGDLDNWTLEWAAEAVLGDDDGYWCCNHNFYLYEHPTRGILFVPWDLEDDFEVQGYDVDPVDGYYSGLFNQPHFDALTQDPVWRPRYVEQLAKMNAAMDPEIVNATIDAWDAQILDAYAADPTRSVGWDEHVETVERMKAWVSARHAFLDSWIACEQGTAADADGDGYSSCDDPDDTDASVSPAGTESCNGIDDDADGWIDDLAECDDCARHDLDDAHLLYCRWPRTNAEAVEACAARGGALRAAQTTGEYYAYFFYTWPVRELWWTGDDCTGWDEANFSTGRDTCSALHPSICALQ